MRFKAYMIKDLGNTHQKRVIANNESEAKRNVKLFNPISKVLDSKWVCK